MLLVLYSIGPKLRPVRARQAPSPSALRQFEDDWWAFYLQNNPESATQLGEYQYNNQLSHYSPEYFSALKQKAAGLLARLQGIDVTKGSEMESLDRILLLRALQDQIRGIDLKAYEMPIDQFNG